MVSIFCAAHQLHHIQAHKSNHLSFIVSKAFEEDPFYSEYFSCISPESSLWSSQNPSAQNWARYIAPSYNHTCKAFQNWPYHLPIGVYFSYEEEIVADDFMGISCQTGVVASIWELFHFGSQSLSSSFQFGTLFPVNWQSFIRCVTGELHSFSWRLIIPLWFYDVYWMLQRRTC